MTPEEQQQVNAMRNYYERQIMNMANEGANAAMVAEGFAVRAKKAEEELAALKKKYETQDNVVPITEPAA